MSDGMLLWRLDDVTYKIDVDRTGARFTSLFRQELTFPLIIPTDMAGRLCGKKLAIKFYAVDEDDE